MPGHTHERGTMNITGKFSATWNVSNGFHNLQTSGCFERGDAQTGRITGEDKNNGTPYGVGFNAANNWTGETSSVGGGNAHSLMQPFLSVFMWRRTN